MRVYRGDLHPELVPRVLEVEAWDGMTDIITLHRKRYFGGAFSGKTSQALELAGLQNIVNTHRSRLHSIEETIKQVWTAPEMNQLTDRPGMLLNWLPNPRDWGWPEIEWPPKRRTRRIFNGSRYL